MSHEINIHFAPGKHNHRILRKGKKPKYMKSSRLPRITRLMALAIKYEDLIKKGLVHSHQELADLAGVDRSQISTILRLRLLSPEIQEWLLNQPETEEGKNPLNLLELRSISTIPSWNGQLQALHRLIPDMYPISEPNTSAHKQKTKGENNDNYSNI